MDSLLPSWKFDNNYAHSDNGRIWIVWHPPVMVVTYKNSSQLVICGVQDPLTNRFFTLACGYPNNKELTCMELWAEITEIIHNSLARNCPCLFIGDFNQIAVAEDHYSLLPSALPLSGIYEIMNCFETNNLFDIPARGVLYTWTNMRDDAPILRNLDRAIINEAWLNAFPQSYAVFEPPGDSDHSPCLVYVLDAIERKRIPFKYFNFFSSHPKFISSSRDAWQAQNRYRSAMFIFAQKLMNAKFMCTTAAFYSLKHNYFKQNWRHVKLGLSLQLQKRDFTNKNRGFDG